LIWRRRADPMSQPMLLEPPSDAELMARVREGDREAFADLVDRHKDAVVTYLARLTADRDRAGDLAQAPFLRGTGHAAEALPKKPSLRFSGPAGDYVGQGFLRPSLSASPPTWCARR